MYRMFLFLTNVEQQYIGIMKDKLNYRQKSFGLRRALSRQLDTHALLISLTSTPLFGRVAKRRLRSQSAFL